MPSAAGARPELPDLAARIAGWARDGEQVEAYVRRSHQTDVRVHEGGIEQLSTAETEGAGIRVVAGHRQGFAWAGSLDDDVLAETLAEARDNADFSSPDEFLGLAGPDGVEAPAIDPYDPELETFPTSARIDLALDLERRVRAGDGRIRALRNTDYGDGLYTTAVATSTGLAAWSRRSVVSLGTTAIAGEGADTQTGHGYVCARRPSDLDVERAATLAVTRSTRLLGARKPVSAQLTAVLEPSVAAAFLSVLAGTLNGESVLKGRSLFVDRLGETVAAPFVSLVEDPGDPTAFTASRYDSEGLASRRVPLIEAGVLTGFLYDTYSGRRAGTASTASAVRGGFKGAPTCGHRAVSLVPGGQSPEEVVAGVELGLLVQTISGLHSGVNPVSGDFSVGAEGLMIRHGELAEPVREITIGSTLQRMLRGVVAVGNDREWLLGPAAHVTLAVSGISMSGQ
ncbi:MAG TPA: TldD/PmbA family protein [Acidimicrobiales bacterium]|nr:TldD/PmbA family protein [Acidimicrobiales bacterium]